MNLEQNFSRKQRLLEAKENKARRITGTIKNDLLKVGGEFLLQLGLPFLQSGELLRLDILGRKLESVVGDVLRGKLQVDTLDSENFGIRH